ncbi:E3 ubiquitin-protein ligase BRE1-like 1 [Carica papaya]|uniref:E3 ubiquitin-protein ligase BRE1-like 1 n=1 Tax=Carica papaya TaxID=3649 RepID=UPI000B8CA864|nr:E3 ubiquitin-protein ligase BRE1-like 1 [Carica papaya]
MIQLDTAVLQFQNQKLTQKLEAQKVESRALENKFSQLKEKQQPYDSTLKVVKESWEGVLTELESCSICVREMGSGGSYRHILNEEDGGSSMSEDAFLSRLIATGATENSFNSCPNQMEEDRDMASEKIKNILSNLVAAINDLWHLKDGLCDAVLKQLPEDGLCRQKALRELQSEVKKLRSSLSDLHLKHRLLSTEFFNQAVINAKNKAKLKCLREEFKIVIAELEEIHCKLSSLKAEKDSTKGAFFPVLNLGNKPLAGDKARDKQREVQDMELALKELTDQASGRLWELRGFHEERIKILEQLSNFQNKLKNIEGISASQAYLLVKDQLEKSKSEVLQYQALLEKLQVEKDNLAWREKELNMKSDLLDVSRRSSAVAESRIADLGSQMQKHIDERSRIEAKLEEASREPGRKEILSEFKALVSSFPEEMSAMQGQLSKYKEAAVDIHSLRADVQSLFSILNRKAKECETISAKSALQISQIHKLQAAAKDLKDSDTELKLILDMFRRESTDSRVLMEAKDLEYKAWAHVQSLKCPLDEQTLELRVKTANEAEAISQQRLAAAEAEIADLRQKLESSKRRLLWNIIDMFFSSRQLDSHMMTCRHKTNSSCSKLQREMIITSSLF